MRLTRTVDVPAGATQRRAAVPAVVRHRAGVRPRHRRGAHRRRRRLDDAARGRRRDADRTAGRVRRATASCSTCTRSSSHYLGGADCTAPGPSGTWNAFTGSHRRLAAGRLRPDAVRRQRGRAVDHLRHRPRLRRRRRVRRRHARGDRRRRPADGFEGATSAWAAGAAPGRVRRPRPSGRSARSWSTSSRRPRPRTACCSGSASSSWPRTPSGRSCSPGRSTTCCG